MSKQFFKKMLIATISISLVVSTLFAAPSIHHYATMSHSSVSELCVDECIDASIPSIIPAISGNAVQLASVSILAASIIFKLPHSLYLLVRPGFRLFRDLVKMNMRYID